MATPHNYYKDHFHIIGGLIAENFLSIDVIGAGNNVEHMNAKKAWHTEPIPHPKTQQSNESNGNKRM